MPPRQIVHAAALIALVGTMLACESWKERVSTALATNIRSSDIGLAKMLNCWLPGGESLASGQIVLADLKVLNVHLGDSDGPLRRFEADVDLTADAELSAKGIFGLPRGPVRLKLVGTAEDKSGWRIHYALPVYSSSTNIAGLELVSRNGQLIEPINSNTASMDPSPRQALNNGPKLLPGVPWNGTFLSSLKPPEGGYSDGMNVVRVYDSMLLAVQANERVRIEIASQTPASIGAVLWPPAFAWQYLPLAARVIPANGKATIEYLSPAAGALRLSVWKGSEPAGSYTVTRSR